MADFFGEDADGDDADEAAEEDDCDCDENPDVDFGFVSDDFDGEGRRGEGAVAVDVQGNFVEVLERGRVFRFRGLHRIRGVDQDVFVFFHRAEECDSRRV